MTGSDYYMHMFFSQTSLGNNYNNNENDIEQRVIETTRWQS